MSQKPIGFPRIEIKGKGTFTPPKPKRLDKSCDLGDYVITGLGHIGTLQKWDFNIASVKSNDGVVKEERC